ncbi:MAG: FlxA-like family protein [Butyrivibrio sp.]|nr:FlxA-like family protein [Butyrivibrio sp.]
MNVNSIHGITNTGSQSFQMKINQGNDAFSKNIQNQIANAQKQLQELSENRDMTPEDNMKKRQEIQKQISDLNNQLRQHQIEQRKEAQQKKDSSDVTGGKPTEKSDKGSTGMSTANMQALISADSSMHQVKTQGAVRTGMKDRAGILETEIKLDKARGVDTAAKEEELAETEQRVQDISASQANRLAAVSDELREATKEDTPVRRTDKDASNEKKDEDDGRLSAGNNVKSLTDRAMAVDVKA